MSKRIEFSTNMKDWKILGAWEDAEFEEKWGKLWTWIEKEQPYGFFRAMDDARTVDEINDEFDKEGKYGL